MAFDKAKALQEAHKYVAQGKAGKAIKHYEWIVENDPGDLILLNVIGDLYARENNVPEALKYFSKLADAYTRDGYKVKAIAIYKKISKLDRDSADPLLRLAELSSAQGLAREAREYYKCALDVFKRKGQQEPALEILRKLSWLDPTDHGLRLGLDSDGTSSKPGGGADLPSGAIQVAKEPAWISRDRGQMTKLTQFREEALEVAQSATSTASLPSAQEASIAQPAVKPEPSPRQIGPNLSQTRDGGGACAMESELPPPKKISLDFQSPLEGKRFTTGPGVVQDCNPSEKPPQPGFTQQAQVLKLTPFNYEESREEIEFYLRHGFYNEAQRALEELEAKYPAEGRVSEFRLRVDHATRESSPPGMTHPAPATDEQVREQAGWNLPTSFFDSAPAAVPVRENEAAAVSGTEDGRVDLIKDLAGELDSEFEDLYNPAMSSGSSATQPGQSCGPGFDHDASAELGSLLDELDDENESGDQSADDEQTHYNLGVAFREMGLLDEAIGEFQKVVSGTGAKHLGRHFLQGCTLLASCFMAKEMPAIAAKWYLRALDAPGLDYEGTLALYYDLGMAFERAGDTTAALEKFTEVYSQNIDFRDVADKIRLLRQTSR